MVADMYMTALISFSPVLPRPSGSWTLRVSLFGADALTTARASGEDCAGVLQSLCLLVYCLMTRELQ